MKDLARDNNRNKANEPEDDILKNEAMPAGRPAPLSDEALGLKKTAPTWEKMEAHCNKGTEDFNFFRIGAAALHFRRALELSDKAEKHGDLKGIQHLEGFARMNLGIIFLDLAQRMEEGTDKSKYYDRAISEFKKAVMIGDQDSRFIPFELRAQHFLAQLRHQDLFTLADNPPQFQKAQTTMQNYLLELVNTFAKLRTTSSLGSMDKDRNDAQKRLQERVDQDIAAGKDLEKLSEYLKSGKATAFRLKRAKHPEDIRLNGKLVSICNGNLEIAMMDIDHLPCDSLNKSQAAIWIATGWAVWCDEMGENFLETGRKNIHRTFTIAERYIDDLDDHRYNPALFIADLGLAYAELLGDFEEADNLLAASENIIGRWGIMEFSEEEYRRQLAETRAKVEALQ